MITARYPPWQQRLDLRAHPVGDEIRVAAKLRSRGGDTPLKHLVNFVLHCALNISGELSLQIFQCLLPSGALAVEGVNGLVKRFTAGLYRRLHLKGLLSAAGHVLIILRERPRDQLVSTTNWILSLSEPDRRVALFSTATSRADQSG